MNQTFLCNKLVRNRTPEHMIRMGATLDWSILTPDDLILALKAKLLEEVEEVRNAKTAQEVIEEIADVKEVLDALLEQMQISQATILEVQKKKYEAKGGFNDGVFVKTITTPMGSELAQRFLSDRSKYPLQENT